MFYAVLCVLFTESETKNVCDDEKECVALFPVCCMQRVRQRMCVTTRKNVLRCSLCVVCRE